MLASVRALRSSAASARRALATSAKATPATSAPMASAAVATASPSADASLLHGELAWCEVYGVDYKQMMQEAHDESPIALNASATASAATQQDIWSVVFGTTH